MVAKFIRIRYIEPGLKPIVPAHEGEWIDLRAAEDIELGVGEFRNIRLGVAMELPDGYEAVIAPRSSTYKKWGIIMACSIGVVDNLYRGDADEWCFPALAFHKTKIYKNDRICQFRIVKQQPQIIFRVVEELGNDNRGGLGSTGDK